MNAISISEIEAAIASTPSIDWDAMATPDLIAALSQRDDLDDLGQVMLDRLIQSQEAMTA